MIDYKKISDEDFLEFIRSDAMAMAALDAVGFGHSFTMGFIQRRREVLEIVIDRYQSQYSEKDDAGSVLK